MKLCLWETANSESLMHEDLSHASLLPRITGKSLHCNALQLRRDSCITADVQTFFSFMCTIHKNLLSCRYHAETALKCLCQSVAINTAQKLYVQGAYKQQIPPLVFQYIHNYVFFWVWLLIWLYHFNRNYVNIILSFYPSLHFHATICH